MLWKEAKKRDGSEVQAVLFDKEKWTLDEAKKWLKDHDFKYGDYRETDKYWRFRQKEPKDGAQYRVIDFGEGEGIHAVIEI